MINKKLTYKEFWSQKGEYGVIRYERMFMRKLKRHKKRSNRERNYGLQVCEYQPNPDCISYCRIPCNGDC